MVVFRKASMVREKESLGSEEEEGGEVLSWWRSSGGEGGRQSTPCTLAKELRPRWEQSAPHFKPGWS